MIDALRTFLAVAKTGSFSRAAEADGVAVSSITRRIDQLEADLDAKLFHRTTRALSLTEAGEALVPRARELVSGMDEARHAVSALHAEPRGNLRISAPAAFGRLHVVPAIASFCARFPLMSVELDASDQMADLAAERLDLAIRTGVLPDSDLLATRLAPQRRIACASPAYLARKGTPRTPEDLLQHDCLTTRLLPTPVDWWRFPGVNGDRPLAIDGPFKVNDSAALLNAAIAGLGVVHLADWLVGEALRTGALVALFTRAAPRAPLRDEAAIHAVRLSGRAQAAKASLFIEHLRACIGDPPYWTIAEAVPRAVTPVPAPRGRRVAASAITPTARRGRAAKRTA